MQPIAVRQRVHVQDRGGDYLVVSIDRDRQVADLVPVNGPETLEEDVPLAALLADEPFSSHPSDHPKSSA